MPLVKIFALTLLALLAFAANSVLCRLALLTYELDAASFTSIRLISAAVVLWLLSRLRKSPHNLKEILSQGDWRAALALFVYAAGFAFAYVSLDTATGALILFACVQLSMLVINLYLGMRLSLLAWLGVASAITGLAYLFLPNVDANQISMQGAGLMALAGLAWGIYSILGKQSKNAQLTTSANFLMTSPFALLLLGLGDYHSLSANGIMLAMASGIFASGLGYSIWYWVLPNLRAEIASTSQLLVPVIAAFGGVVFVNEPITLQLVIASTAILGGILLVLFAPKKT